MERLYCQKSRENKEISNKKTIFRTTRNYSIFPTVGIQNNQYPNIMLIILSPAKTMDMSISGTMPQGTFPLYDKEAEFLASEMKKYSVPELEKLLKVSSKLAEINYERYQRFDLPDTPRKPALLAYNGSVFKALLANRFGPEDFAYAQERIRIISTLYGLVRPLDLIKAYRIAFYLKLGSGKDDLYQYWLPLLTRPLIESVRNAGGTLVNLASLDVLGALRMNEISREVRVITPEFKELRKGKYETVRTYAKIARGEMCGNIIRNRIESPEILKQFEWNGFSFNPEISDDKNYVFTRKN